MDDTLTYFDTQMLEEEEGNSEGNNQDFIPEGTSGLVGLKPQKTKSCHRIKDDNNKDDCDPDGLNNPPPDSSESSDDDDDDKYRSKYFKCYGREPQQGSVL